MKRLLGSFKPNTIIIKNTSEIYSPPNSWKMIIDSDWKEFQKKARKSGGKIWNGKVYRLNKIEKNREKYILYLGSLGFKTHHATPLLVENFKTFDFGERPNGMYISSYIRTADGKFVFGSKGKKATSKHNINLLGGVLNRDEMKINDSNDIFGYFYKELQEETGLKRKDVKGSQGLGIFMANDSKIFILLETVLHLSSAKFLENVRLSSEHEGFLLLKRSEIKGLLKSKKENLNPNIISTINLVRGQNLI